MAVRTLDIKLVGHNEIGAATREADRDLRRLTMEAERSAQRFQERMARDFSVPRTQGLMDRRDLVASRTVEDQLYRETRAIELRRIREETMRAARESRMQLIQQRVRADLGLEVSAAVQREKIVGQAVVKEAAKQGQQASAARTGMIGGFSQQQMQLLIRGGAVAMAGMTLGQMTDKMVEMRDLASDGKANWADISLEIGKSIPLLGGFVRAGENINELLTGQKRHWRELQQHVDSVNRSIDVHRRTLADTAGIRQQTQLSGEARREAIGLIGMPEPMRAIEAEKLRIRQIERESKAREEAELAAIRNDQEAQKTIGELENQLRNLVIPDASEARTEALRRRDELQRQIDSLKKARDDRAAAVTEREEQTRALGREEGEAKIRELEKAAAEAERTARREHFRAMEEEARVHRRRLLGIEEEGEVHRLRSAEQWAEAERLEIKRRYDQQIADLREQTQKRWQEANDAREGGNRAEAQRREELATLTQRQNAETERALRARQQQELEQQARNERIAGLERERTVYGELFRLRMDFIDTSTEFGRKEAERLRIEEKHLAIQERMSELLRDQTLSAEERRAIETMRAGLPEQMQRELDQVGKREPGRVSPYAQGVSGRGFTGASETMAAKIVDAEAQQRAKQTKAAEESAKAAKEMLTELKQLPQRLREALNLESR